MRIKHSSINNKKHSLPIKLRIGVHWWIILSFFVLLVSYYPEGTFRVEQLIPESFIYESMEIHVSGRSGQCRIYSVDGTKYIIPYRSAWEKSPGLNIDEFERNIKKGDQIQVLLTPSNRQKCIAHLETNGKCYFSLDDTNRMISNTMLGLNIIIPIVGGILVADLLFMFRKQNLYLFEYIHRERKRKHKQKLNHKKTRGRFMRE